MRSNGSAGFTLLEIVLAMAILLFGMAAILGMLTMGAALTRTAEMRTQSSTAIQAVMADLEETLFPPNTDDAPGASELGPPQEIREKALPGVSAIVYSAKAVPNPARESEYRVDVELAWHSAGVRREKRFSTILLRELPFGERLRRQFIEGRARATPAAPTEAPAPPGAAPKK